MIQTVEDLFFCTHNEQKQWPEAEWRHCRFVQNTEHCNNVYFATWASFQRTTRTGVRCRGSWNTDRILKPTTYMHVYVLDARINIHILCLLVPLPYFWQVLSIFLWIQRVTSCGLLQEAVVAPTHPLRTTLPPCPQRLEEILGESIPNLIMQAPQRVQAQDHWKQPCTPSQTWGWSAEGVHKHRLRIGKPPPSCRSLPPLRHSRPTIPKRSENSKGGAGGPETPKRPERISNYHPPINLCKLNSQNNFSCDLTKIVTGFDSPETKTCHVIFLQDKFRHGFFLQD